MLKPIFLHHVSKQFKNAPVYFQDTIFGNR